MPQYLVILEKLIDLLIENIKDKIHSIYIYGSVGRGTAIWGESDIDLTIVLYSKLNEVEVNKLNDAKNNFLLENKDIPKIDFDIVVLGDVLKTENFYYWGFWIKHICACIYGDDLATRFPKMKPNKITCIMLNQDISDTLIEYKTKITTGDFDSTILISVLKRILRAAYCLVSHIDKSWAVKIQDICYILKHYFPDEYKFKEIEFLLEDTSNISYIKVLEIIDYFSIWFKDID